MDEITIAGQNHKVINLPGRPAAMLDRSVAELYEVSTKEINQARSRNDAKFPQEFAYQLTKEELAKVVTICDRPGNQYLPWAYTWEGCNMLATILKSDVATQRAIQIVRGFTNVEKKVQDFAALPDLSGDHPLLISMRHMVDVTVKYVKVEEEQKRLALVQQEQEAEIKELQVKTSAIIEQSGFYTILAFARKVGVKVPIELATQLGKEAAKLSRAAGLRIGKAADTRYGTVNTYHYSILKEIFGSMQN